MATVDFEVWLNHFEHHARHPRCLPPGIVSRLMPDERRRIASSIATFQLGEQSEGRTLLKAAQVFAHARGAPAVVRIVELLIREEQSHAALLLAYMSEHRIASRRTHWTDHCFRRMRRLSGLEFYLYVLISAELIGIIYYRALERSTSCPRLRALCRVLVSDELAHVGFESQLLHSLAACRPACVRGLLRFAHRGFLAGAAGVVWWTHRAVLRASGYSAHGFLRACLSQDAFYLGPIGAPRATTAGTARPAERQPR